MMAPMSVASSSGSPILSFAVLLGELGEEVVEDVGVQEQARAGRARLALAREAHRRDDAVDDPVLVGVGIDDGRALAAELERHRHDAVGRRRMMSLPTSVEPVNESLRTPGWAESAAPASSP